MTESIAELLADPRLRIVRRRFRLTDLGNAERLIAQHGTDLRYCHPWRCWLVWDGTRWRADDTAEAVRRAKQTVRSIYREAAEAEDEDERKALGGWAKQSEADGRIRAMLSVAASEPGVPVLPGELDADPWAFNVANGTLDLRTGQLRPHGRADLLTKLAPAPYDPAADAPRWQRFLDRIMDGQAELVAYLQRAVGYSLTGSTGEECLFIPYGSGRNGKSRFIGATQHILGDYGQQMPSSTLLSKPGGADGIPNDVARLKGVRFAAAVETEQGRRLDEELVKRLTGGDKLTARFLRAEFFEFTAECKLWVATNHKPTVSGTDEGIWSRMRLVPFTVTIPPAERDKGLADKLAAEAPGILAWAVAGCLAWQQRGLHEPAAVLDATADYRAEQDTLGEFIQQCCQTGRNCYAHAGELLAAYQDFSGDRRISQRLFGMKLRERGYDSTRMGHSNRHAWIGLGLRSPDGLHRAECEPIGRSANR
jgi:putative DNA primase/helicase